MINKALSLNYKLTYFISSLEEVRMTVFAVHHEKQITNNTFLQKKVLVYYNKVKKCHNIASLEGHKSHLKANSWRAFYQPTGTRSTVSISTDLRNIWNPLYCTYKCLKGLVYVVLSDYFIFSLWFGFGIPKTTFRLYTENYIVLP